MVTVSNCFEHWIREIEVKRCGGQIASCSYFYSIYLLIFEHHAKSNAKECIRNIKKKIIVAIKKIVLTSDRSNRSDKNLTKIITKFHDYVGEEHTYSILLRFYGR